MNRGTWERIFQLPTILVGVAILLVIVGLWQGTKGLVDLAEIATPIVIAIGFFFAYRHWKTLQAARMAQIILSISERWDSEEIMRGRRLTYDYERNLTAKLKELGDANSHEWYELTSVPNFFDTLGSIVMEGLLSRSMAYKLFGETALNYFRLYQPSMQEPGQELYWQYFISLITVLNEEKPKHAPPATKAKTAP